MSTTQRPARSQEVQLDCPECGSQMVFRSSRFGYFYGCNRYPACSGSHGAHSDGRPLGVPANKETKQARQLAHAAFDKLWQEGYMTRDEAYQKLQELMGLPAKDAHIAMFSKEQCETLMLKMLRLRYGQDKTE